MKLLIEPTETILHFNGTPCRVWKETTETGIEVIAMVNSIAIAKTEPIEVQEFFERELKELPDPIIVIRNEFAHENTLVL